MLRAIELLSELLPRLRPVANGGFFFEEGPWPGSRWTRPCAGADRPAFRQPQPNPHQRPSWSRAGLRSICRLLLGRDSYPLVCPAIKIARRGVAREATPNNLA